MCVAIYKPVGLKLDEDTLFNCFTKNPDGCGFAYTTGSELVVFKTMEYTTFLEEYNKCYGEYGESSPFLLHFRIATHGTVDIFNCHPFVVNKDYVFIHNGVLNNVPACSDKKKSDTQIFNELILQNLPEDCWFENAAIKYLLEDFISFSKMVIMNVKGEVLILNEAKGTWVDGVWFSNTLWKTTSLWEGRGGGTSSIYSSSWDDYCINCGKFIRYNIYSRRTDECFCSGKCKAEWRKDIEQYKQRTATGTDSSPIISQTCAVCGKSGTMVFSDYKTGKPRCYCSWVCKDKDDAAMKEEEAAQLEYKIKCLYCGEHKPARDSFEVVFDDSLVEGGAQIVEYICIDCIDDAAEAGVLEMTDELVAAACKILNERK